MKEVEGYSDRAQERYMYISLLYSKSRSTLGYGSDNT